MSINKKSKAGAANAGEQQKKSGGFKVVCRAADLEGKHLAVVKLAVENIAERVLASNLSSYVQGNHSKSVQQTEQHAAELLQTMLSRCVNADFPWTVLMVPNTGAAYALKNRKKSMAQFDIIPNNRSNTSTSIRVIICQSPGVEFAVPNEFAFFQKIADHNKSKSGRTDEDGEAEDTRPAPSKHAVAVGLRKSQSEFSYEMDTNVDSEVIARIRSFFQYNIFEDEARNKFVENLAKDGEFNKADFLARSIRNHLNTHFDKTEIAIDEKDKAKDWSSIWNVIVGEADSFSIATPQDARHKIQLTAGKLRILVYEHHSISKTWLERLAAVESQTIFGTVPPVILLLILATVTARSHYCGEIPTALENIMPNMKPTNPPAIEELTGFSQWLCLRTESEMDNGSHLMVVLGAVLIASMVLKRLSPFIDKARGKNKRSLGMTNQQIINDVCEGVGAVVSTSNAGEKKKRK